MSQRRTLHVGDDAERGAASLEEAIARLLAEEYEAIMLHCRSTEWDEHGVVAYLAGTWPQFLCSLEVTSVSPDGVAAVWNAAAGRFEQTAAPRDQRRRVRETGPVPSAVSRMLPTMPRMAPVSNGLAITPCTTPGSRRRVISSVAAVSTRTI